MDGCPNSNHLNLRLLWLLSVVGLHANFVPSTHTATSPNRYVLHSSSTRRIIMTPLWLLVVLPKSALHPCKMCQKRRNNRQLQRFYDAKYIDKRTIDLSKKPKAASGQELSSGRRTRNKNKSGPNLRIYRGKKVRKGRRSIRRKRYPLQPLDVVSWKAEKYVVKGTHGYGRYVRLKSQIGEVFDK